MGYRLQYLAHDLELAQGEFVIGRGLDCQLALDDPLVSRRHASIEVGDERLVLRDLGSRNGVLLNGAAIEGPALLKEGDVVRIGSQVMTIRSVDGMRAMTETSVNFRRVETGQMPIVAVDAASEPTSLGIVMRPASQVPKLSGALRHLVPLADKALAMRNGVEAERMLSAVMFQLRDEARSGQKTGEMLPLAVEYAVKLAAHVGKVEWVDYAVELCLLEGALMQAHVVDMLYATLRKVPRPRMPLLRSYLELVQARYGQRSAADRFVVKRIEGLVQLAASR